MEWRRQTRHRPLESRYTGYTTPPIKVGTKLKILIFFRFLKQSKFAWGFYVTRDQSERPLYSRIWTRSPPRKSSVNNSYKMVGNPRMAKMEEYGNFFLHFSEVPQSDPHCAQCPPMYPAVLTKSSSSSEMCVSLPLPKLNDSVVRPKLT